MIRKYKKTFIVAILVLILVIESMVWLAIAIVLFVLIINIALYCISLIRYDFLRKAFKGIFLFVFFLSMAISIKLLAFDIYKIPSSSMENMLYSGDVIMVNKLKYGPKLPCSPFEIPWVNLGFYMNKTARSRIKETWWDYRRLGGTTRIKQGDVFVFSFGQSRDFFVVKRCVGLPGDALSIRDGEIYTNNKLFIAPGTVKNKFEFRIKNQIQLYKLMDSLDNYVEISGNYKFGKLGSATFSNDELGILMKTNCIDSIKSNRLNTPNEELIKTPHSKWTMDNMGSIVIPKKDMRIALNPDTFMLYGNIMKLFEKNSVVEKNGNYFINGKKTTTYRFKLNYYFMMGDNRRETVDSRFWGFLPETNILGKVQYILFSNKNDEFQWNRLFKVL